MFRLNDNFKSLDKQVKPLNALLNTDMICQNANGCYAN